VIRRLFRQMSRHRRKTPIPGRQDVFIARGPRSDDLPDRDFDHDKAKMNKKFGTLKNTMQKWIKIIRRKTHQACLPWTARTLSMSAPMTFASVSRTMRDER